MRTFMAAALALMSISSAYAQQPQWYILSFFTRQCELAANRMQFFRSPLAQEIWLRDLHQYRETVVTRNPDGTIQSAQVMGVDNIGVLFINGAAKCNETKRRALENGVFTDPSELR